MAPAAELAGRLAQNAEAVCREYLSNGRREGNTWRVGDVDNTPGRSLMVRLTGPDSGKGAAGRWVDFATAETGDLLDLIARTCRLHTFRDVLDEARRFLSLPREGPRSTPARPPVPSGSPEAAQRLFASARPILGTLAAIYLRSRGITDVHDLSALRFHPRCFYRAHEGAPREMWPALLAAACRRLDGQKEEAAALNTPNGRIAHRFHARDQHLVMGPAAPGTSLRFRVLIDGLPPSGARGIDVDEQGNGTVTEQRLYQLIRQPQPIADRQLEIEFLDPGVEAYAFTFG